MKTINLIRKNFSQIANKQSLSFFAEAEIRIGLIDSAVSIENSDKIYQLSVNFKDFSRQIMSGLKPFYSEKDLIGRKCLFCLNIKPRKVATFISQGMILCPSRDGKISLIEPEKVCQEGEPVFVEGLKSNFEGKELNPKKLTKVLDVLFVDGDGFLRVEDKFLEVSSGKLVSKLINASVV